MRNKKGFTLIEMLVVIAIIAVLVSIVIPTVSASTTKAKAAADAANLRSTLGALNAAVTMEGDLEGKVRDTVTPESLYEAGCELHILYTNPGFIEVYFVKDTVYYSLDYLSSIALNGSPAGDPPGKPSTAGTWYQAGVGKLG